MVNKRSEYRQQFKVSSLLKNVPVYKENLNYRYSRRERECAHTPICWDDDPIDSDSDEKLTPDEEVDKLPVADIAVIDEENESGDNEGNVVDREKREAQANDKVKVENSKKQTGADVEIVRQNEALRKSAKEKLNKYVCMENKDEPPTSVEDPVKKSSLSKTFVKPKLADEKAFVKSSKPKRPDRLNKIPKARPTSAPAERPASREGAKTPFMAYGCGENTRSMGQKKTFNVRATSAVYPAALRAQKRNQLLIEKQQEKQRSASAREKRKKALFNQKMARETVIWESEYSRNYPAYSNTEYAKSGPDRSPRKQKSYFLT